MSFQQKRALVSLIAVWIAAVGCVARLLRSPPETLAQAAPTLVGAAVGLTVLMIMAHIVLIVGAGAEQARQPAREAARKARLLAWRNALAIMALGGCTIAALKLAALPPVLLLEAGAAAVVLAQMVYYGSEALYGRGAAQTPQAL